MGFYYFFNQDPNAIEAQWNILLELIISLPIAVSLIFLLPIFKGRREKTNK